jgi:tetratricopeptide (TPR) repeat protein
MAIRSSRAYGLLLLGLLLLLPLGSPRPASFKREMAFAVDLAEKGLWNEAAHRFLSLLKQEPNNPRLWNDLAVSYEAMGDYDKANEAYTKALKLMAHPPDSLLANNEAFQSFYRTWKDPSVAGPPPLVDPRTAPPRPVKSGLPVFPGPDFDDGDNEGELDPARPIFPDEEADMEAAAAGATAADSDSPAKDETPIPEAQPPADAVDEEEALADPYPMGDDPQPTEPPADPSPTEDNDDEDPSR